MSKQYFTTEENNLKSRIEHLEGELKQEKAYTSDLKKQLAGSRKGFKACLLIRIKQLEDRIRDTDNLTPDQNFDVGYFKGSATIEERTFLIVHE